MTMSITEHVQAEVEDIFSSPWRFCDLALSTKIWTCLLIGKLRANMVSFTTLVNRRVLCVI